MAKDDLVGNLATEVILEYLQQQGVNTGIDMNEFNVGMALANQVFPVH